MISLSISVLIHMLRIMTVPLLFIDRLFCKTLLVIDTLVGKTLTALESALIQLDKQAQQLLRNVGRTTVSCMTGTKDWLLANIMAAAGLFNSFWMTVLFVFNGDIIYVAAALIWSLLWVMPVYKTYQHRGHHTQQAQQHPDEPQFRILN